MILKPSKIFQYLFLVLFSSSVWAQSCKEVSVWMDVIKNEHPTLKLTTYVPRNTIENLAVNLYSDKYFVPFRGKSFSGLSEKARTKDWRKIQSCYIKNGYQSIPDKAWVFNNIIYNYLIDFRSDVFSNKVVARNQLRDELSQELKRLTNDQLGYNDVQTLRSELNSKYAVLFPSEIEASLSKVNEYESISADKMLLKKAEVASNLPKTKVSLEALLNFESVNRELYSKASKQTKTQVNRDIESKTKDLVDYLMPKEVLKLAGTKSTDANAQKINRLIADFKKDYNQVLHIESAQQTLQLFRKRKTQIISNMMSYLTAGIESAKSQDELDTLDKLILSDLDQSSAIYIDLADNINKQRQSIIDEQNRLAQEERKKATEAQRLFTEESKRRAQTIAKFQKEVEVKRSELNQKYGIDFPTFEDLHYILQAHIYLFDANNRYNANDGVAFKNLVEKNGFYRVSTKNMSKIERFEDKNGFSIESYVSKDRSSGNTKLYIPNASKDIVEMYHKELVANYRNRLKPNKNPNVEDYNRDAYVNSGRTLYEYSVSKNNTLIVQARSNIQAKTTIKAEQIDAFTLKVEPFTNYTNLWLKKGQTVTLSASGKMKVGNFLGNSGPDGIKALSIYNFDKRFNHGGLLGKFGENGVWFWVGKGGSFTSNVDGSLYLKVNDRLVNDNEGYYTVKYKIE